MNIGIDGGRVLNFDIEARPLGWYGGDFTHKEVTAIACAWEDDPEDSMEVYMLTKRVGSARAMLRHFAARYSEARLVVGHFIRGFDLPTLQANYVEQGLPLLGEKYTHDTKLDLLKMSGISKSQENLASWLGLPTPKIGMSMEDWRKANRLTSEGRDIVRERVVGDVRQNIAMHRKLQERGLLAPPSLWVPSAGALADYTP